MKWVQSAESRIILLWFDARSTLMTCRMGAEIFKFSGVSPGPPLGGLLVFVNIKKLTAFKLVL